MFDITTAREVTYGPDGQLRVTVFQDRTEKNIWYMVPVPRLRIQDGQPALSLTRYIDKDETAAGVCVFEVELHSPEEARAAARAQIPEIQGWGQFTWISGDAFFAFDLSVEGKFKREQVARSPSLFGSNVAHFVVELPTEMDVNAFASALTEPGSVSPFLVEYDMGVLTQLLAAKATVSYKATAAIDYERRYETRKDTWGNSKKVLVEVRQVLKESGAGEVTVTPGVGATEELIQLVRDWAWTTLETQVADTVETARELAKGTTNPVTATSDFTNTYSEDAIVEWSTPVSRFLPRFDQETWRKLYREVDNRELVVVFQLAGDPYDADGKILYEDVEITVDYPTRKTDNTFKLIPGTDALVAKTYVAPGEAVFDPTYRYKFTVNFPGGAPPYTSDWITETATLVSLLPNRFGVRNVSFVGVNVPFDGDVVRVLVDFYDNPPVGQPPKLQTKEMTANGVAVKFTTTYHVPITNTYDYRLRYLMKDGSVVTMQPDQQFGSENADLVQVLDPSPRLANLAIRAIVTGDGGGFLDVNANASYFDDQNPSEAKPLNYDWSGWAPGTAPGIYSAETWRFDAQPDTQTAFFRLNGQIVFGDGDIFELNDLRVAYSKKPLILKDTEEVYSVQIITDQIDWTAVGRVSVNVFQLIDSDGNVSSGMAAPSAAYLVPSPALAGPEAAQVEATRTALIPYDILPPEHQAKSLPLYYTLRKLRSADEVVFYFNATYAMLDGTVRSIGDSPVTGRLQIHLPRLPDGQAPGHIQRFAVKPG